MPFNCDYVNRSMGRCFKLNVAEYTCGHFDGDEVTYIKMSPNLSSYCLVRNSESTLTVHDIPCFICPDCGDVVYSSVVEWILINLRTKSEITGDISFGVVT